MSISKQVDQCIKQRMWHKKYIELWLYTINFVVQKKKKNFSITVQDNYYYINQLLM